MSQTNRDHRKNYAFALAPQTAKGVAASSVGALCIASDDVKHNIDRDMIHPLGTTGSQFKKDTIRNVTIKPKITAKVRGSREFLGPILEMICFGAPTVSAAQLTEAGDGANVLSAYALTGVRPGFNTEYIAGVCKLYISLASNVINIYKDAARSLLVAHGACASGVVTLTADNSSGLGGVITCSSATPANNAAITTILNTISMVLASVPACYWTAFVDDGKVLRTFQDCVMKSVSFSSSDRGPLEVEIELWSMGYTFGATALAPTIAANTVYAHNGDLVVRNQTAGAPVTQDPTQIGFSFDRDLMALMGTQTSPQDIISKLVTLTLKAKFEPTSELDTLLALVGTLDQLDMKFTNGAKLLSFSFANCFLKNPNGPGFSGDDVDSVDLDWEVVEATAASPAAPVVITYQP